MSEIRTSSRMEESPLLTGTDMPNESKRRRLYLVMLIFVIAGLATLGIGYSSNSSQGQSGLGKKQYETRDGAGSDCIACDAGKYCNEWTFARYECKSCRPGTYASSRGVRRSCTPAQCGHFVKNYGSTSQQQCGMGEYQPNTGQSSCIDCPDGMHIWVDRCSIYEKGSDGGYVADEQLLKLWSRMRTNSYREASSIFSVSPDAKFGFFNGVGRPQVAPLTLIEMEGRKMIDFRATHKVIDKNEKLFLIYPSNTVVVVAANKKRTIEGLYLGSADGKMHPKVVEADLFA